MMELRPYQRAAVDGLFNYFQNKKGNPMVVIPTAGGKSLIMASFIKETLERWPEEPTRFLVLTHVRELVRQNSEEMAKIWPTAPIGVYSAGLKRREAGALVTFASIQSVFKRAKQLGEIEIVIVDEAHLIPRKSNTMYQKLFNDLKEINPHLKIVAFTATPFRMDSGRLDRGDDAMFHGTAYEAGIVDLIEQGYLARPTSVSAATQIDTSDVAIRGGEFVPGQLQAVAIRPETVAAVADEIMTHSEGRRGILVFGCGVLHAEMLCDALNDRGLPCEAVFGDTPLDERDRHIEAFKRQELRALCGMNVLTTGFNARHVDLIALARPTKSVGLYIQIVGRGTRVFPGKEDCRVLDFGGNIARHGPLDKPKVKPEKTTTELQPAPTKVCGECGAVNHLSARVCEVCKVAFPEILAEIDTKPSTLPLFSGEAARPVWVPVDAASYRFHPPKSEDKPPTLRVVYRSGFLTYTEWLCFEHHGFPRRKAERWWRLRAPRDVPPPSTVREALSYTNTLRVPDRILIQPNGRFFDVIDADIPRHVDAETV